LDGVLQAEQPKSKQTDKAEEYQTSYRELVSI
jgi:hypothetical protein